MAMESTPEWGIEWPDGNEEFDPQGHLKRLAETTDGALSALRDLPPEDVVLAPEGVYGGTARAVKAGGVVTLRGHFTRSGYAGTEVMGYLPVGFRPPVGPDIRAYVPAGTGVSNVTGMRQCVINSAGHVQIIGSGNTSTFHVTGISFTVQP